MLSLPLSLLSLMLSMLSLPLSGIVLLGAQKFLADSQKKCCTA
jgi:hypothetical protein